MRFIPEQHGVMSWVGGPLAGPETFADAAGRRIIFGWILEARMMQTWMRDGWASCLSLPWVLEPDARHGLLVKPAEELNRLREDECRCVQLAVPDHGEALLPGIEGNQMELMLEIETASDAVCGVKLFCSPDGEEQTAVYYDGVRKVLGVDVTRSSRDHIGDYALFMRQPAQPETAPDFVPHELPFVLDEGETLYLRIYIDRSVMEVFANERQCVTQRVYPCRPDSRQVRFFARGGGLLRQARAWPMTRTNPW